LNDFSVALLALSRADRHVEAELQQPFYLGTTEDALRANGWAMS